MVVLLLVFGAKRLPEMGRSIGHGMREFKDAVTGNDDEPEKIELTPPPAPDSARSAGHAADASPSAIESERVSN